MNKLLSIAKVQLMMRVTSTMWIFVVIIQPILFLIMTLFIMDIEIRETYTMAAILGAGMMGTWSSILFSSGGDIDRERRWGTLEMIVGCPTPLWYIIGGKSLANGFAGIISMTLSFLTALIFFDGRLSITNLFWFIIVLLLNIISLSSLGMIICTLFTISRAARGLMNLMENPIFLLCGIMFPITILPLWTRPFSYVLSLTWGIEGLRMAVMGIVDYQRFLFHILMIVLLTIVYLLISAKLFLIVEKKAKKEATLGVY
ncbi:ABC transporter permease [Paramaledivibacter caminithermalis]|jgi:ABC-2 type transport system permease protein|uniref:Transport permease protein n=1 Tax=Paramaledivibacter caminithermalis (strain DSM 15212 / CIP 107654 / DViRD3) TaxID=1121301 RepID=A0A1M6QGS6_PARC5|nr:ABC transporter permease [Paramaledivibacter caminithermalis]SHK19310.1 ABC-2 type transport system permease protein [Paramaledivibacter caminithermalis DSM 15212]